MKRETKSCFSVSLLLITLHMSEKLHFIIIIAK